MSVDPRRVRVDLQVEGTGVRGHQMLIDEEWDYVRRVGWTLAAVNDANVTCHYTMIPQEGHSEQRIGDKELFGVFVPDKDVVFIPADVYEEIG